MAVGGERWVPERPKHRHARQPYSAAVFTIHPGQECHTAPFSHTTPQPSQSGVPNNRNWFSSREWATLDAGRRPPLQLSMKAGGCMSGRVWDPPHREDKRVCPPQL